MTKGPSGVLQDSPSWLLSSEGKGKKSLAPSPERIPVHDSSLQRTPQFLLWYPSAFDALCRRLPFPSVFQLPMESPRQKSPVPILGVSLAVPRRLCRELSSPLLLRFPFLNESWAGAGRAAAAESQLWPLPPPVPAGQTKQVQSHHEGREGERMPCAP